MYLNFANFYCQFCYISEKITEVMVSLLLSMYTTCIGFAVDNLPKRIENINNYFTFSLYSNVCRS